MKDRIRFGLLGVLPVVLLALSIAFYGTTGHSFLGLVFLGLAAVSGVYLLLFACKKHHPKEAKRMLLILTALVLAAVTMVSVVLVLVMNTARGDGDTRCEYVVVLGAAVRSYGPSYPLQERVAEAYRYMQSNPDAIIIVSGGQGHDEPMTEAKCMYDMLLRMGADPERIWMEEKATSTWENLQFTMNLIRERTGNTPSRLGIISSEYHLYRAKLFASRCGVESVGIPAETRWLSLRINNYLREVAGVWHYLILGGNYND